MSAKEIIAQIDARRDFNDQLDWKGRRLTRLQSVDLIARLIYSAAHRINSF